MNKINRKLEYALIALKHMRSKSQGERTTVSEISSLYRTPFDATARVLQQLVQHDILKSEQGIHGGYIIIKDLNHVSLYEVLEIVVGPVELAKCFSKEKSESSCEIQNLCSILSPMQILNRRLIEFYRSIRLSELLEPRRNFENLERTL